MIVYGTKGKMLGSVQTDAICPKCRKGQLNVVAAQKYAHVWHIPFFPMGKKIVGICNACHENTDPKEFKNLAIRNREQLMKGFKTPIWTFSFCAVLIAFITAIVVNDHFDDKARAALLAEPHIGDVYVLELPAEVAHDEFRYTYGKVVGLTEKHGLSLKMGNKAFNQSTGVKEETTAVPTNYSEEVVDFEAGTMPKVLEVIRPKTESTDSSS